MGDTARAEELAPMEAFLPGLFAAIGVAVGARYAVGALNWSSAAKHSSPSVRL